MGDDSGDDLLGLIFTACHPCLSTDARVALTLRLLGGLSTAELARAYLVPQPTIAQRIVRAKRPLAEPAAPFAVERAASLSGALRPYALQAAIAACHARARTADETDWIRIVALYDALAEIAPSPVVDLNRAVAVGMAYGPAAGLELVDELAAEPTLQGYHLLPSVRGDLLAKLHRFHEARREFERAASLTGNLPERRLLLERAAACVQNGRV